MKNALVTVISVSVTCPYCGAILDGSEEGADQTSVNCYSEPTAVCGGCGKTFKMPDLGLILEKEIRPRRPRSH
jgi:hypothetical protein